jgi:hypothetical protein
MGPGRSRLFGPAEVEGDDAAGDQLVINAIEAGLEHFGHQFGGPGKLADRFGR